MINLLPNDYKLHLRYGRLNVRLSRWLVAGLTMLAGLVMILAMGWLYINNQISDLNSSNAATKAQLDSQNLVKVRSQADEINQNIKIINQILNSEIRFSALIQEVGRVMPNGTVLTGLRLSDKINGGLDLGANAVDSTAAAQIAVNLGDPKNNLFSKVDILDVKCSSKSPNYHCAVNLRVLFDDKAAKRFINVPAAGDNQ